MKLPAFVTGLLAIAILSSPLEARPDAALSTNPDTLMGRACEYGERAVAIDLRKALAHYERAARAGDAEALYHLGFALKSLQSRKMQLQAVDFFTQASKQNHHDATYQLGLMYRYGKGVSQDEAKALSCFRLAAGWGHAASCFKMGIASKEGNGAPPNQDEAIRWFKKAASQGEPYAMSHLAGIYAFETGNMTNGVPPGYWSEEALYWYYRSYLAGNCKVASMLAALDHEAKMLQKFKERARAELGKDLVLEKNGDWRIQPTLKPEDPRYWALATSALLVEMNEGEHDLLGTDVREWDLSRKRIAWLLFNTWGVGNREDLLNDLDGLKTKGDRADFDRIAKALEREEAGDTNAVEELLKAGLKYKVEVVKADRKKVGGKSLLGFDYSRYVTLCRWGYMVGYLGEKEAWDRIMPAARKIKESFDSWDDLAANYLVGRRFISARLTQESGDQFEQKAKRMLRDYNSPWVLCKWERGLSEPTPAASAPQAEPVLPKMPH
jgi:tetratricopeptide (TPR) repeat protein